MSPRFVHLNLHTEYSIVDGVVRIPELMASCIKADLPAVAITDQSNLFGLIKFYQAAINAGIKPIIGVDIWLKHLVDSVGPTFSAAYESSHERTQSYSRVTLLAQNADGYKNIVELISRAYLEGQKSGQPVIERSWLENLNGGIIVLSGAQYGDIGAAMLSGNTKKVERIIDWWQRFFADRFYLELQRIGRAGEEDYINLALDAAEKHGLPVVATNSVLFLNPDDFYAHEARFCINAGYILEDQNRPRPYSRDQYLRSADEMLELFADIPEAIVNTVEIAKRCNVELTLGKTFLPIFPVPQNLSVSEHLAKEAGQGLDKYMLKLDKDLPLATNENRAARRELYEKRLQYELDVIKTMGFPGYFLIVADFIRWAKEHDIPVGPGRGSGAGSLVAYALGITNLDPIIHELLFERFLNPDRISLPDFDIDFCMTGRDRVIEYVVSKYGCDKVAQIITHGTMAARAAVRDVGRVLGLPYSFVDKVAKLIPFELGISLDKALQDEEMLRQRYQQEEDVHTLIDLAKKLEGIVRNVGKHAGGVVIAPSKLTDFMPLYHEANEPEANAITQFDKDDVATVGLVKFDFLGLRTLTIIQWALRTINAKRAQQNLSPIDINALPLDDAATFRLIQSCSTMAVFQIESRGMRDLVRRLRPDCFSDIVALVALYRPGPLQSGMHEDFIRRKKGQEPISYLHPSLESILRPTYGVILYQEQVMQIAQKLAGYSLGAADILRSAMGKKKVQEMAQQRAVFLAGAAQKGVDKHEANVIFELIEKFAGYGFNKSHSAAYAILTYQTAWLKAHYPVEFMAAVLSSEMNNTDKIAELVHECRDMGIVVEQPNINDGFYEFTVKYGEGASEDGTKNKAIRYGLGAIKGVGESALENILAQRDDNHSEGKRAKKKQKNSRKTEDANTPKDINNKFSDIFDFCLRVDARKVNRRVIEALVYAGAFDKIVPNRASSIASLERAISAAEHEERHARVGQLSIDAMLEFDDDEDNSDESSLPINMPSNCVGGGSKGLSNGAGSQSSGLYSQVKEWSDSEKLEYEKGVLGFFLSGHPIQQYREELNKIVSGGISKYLHLEDLESKGNKMAILAGLVNSMRLLTTKAGKKMAVVRLEDESGNIELTLFADVYEKARSCLGEGKVLIVEAEIGVDAFSGNVRARATQIRTLEEARTAYAKGLVLTLEGENVAGNMVSNLQGILSMHDRGSCPVYIAYEQDGTSAQVMLGKKWQVQLKDALLNQLRDLLGKECVMVCY